MPVSIRTLSDQRVTLTDQQVDEELRPSFRGSLLTAQDEGYHAARAVENRRRFSSAKVRILLRALMLVAERIRSL